MYDNQHPCITVLMSVFTEKEEYLKEAIDSIRKQMFRNFEFIIYDDCSNQKIKKILKDYEDIDDRIRIIHNKINKGLTFNLAEGVKIARGRYICRQDSDDVSLPSRFELQLKYMESHPDVAVLGTGYYLYKNNNKKRRAFGLTNPNAIETRLFFGNSHIMHSSVMIRKSFLENYSLNYDINFKKAQDFDLWTRVSKCGKITILKKRLCLYRIHENQISSNKNTKAEQYECFLRIIDRQLCELRIKPTEKERELHHALMCFQPVGTITQMLKWAFKLIVSNNERKRYHPFYFTIYCFRRLFIYIIKSVKESCR